MIKWFAYIVMLLIFAPRVSVALTKTNGHDLLQGRAFTVLNAHKLTDTIIIKKKVQDDDDKNKIKEVSKAKRQAKPEKIDDDKPRSRREQRPAGMERPPEIPRRNNN